MPQGAPVPTVTHLHGAEVSSYYDGGPEQWFTPNGIHGPAYGTNPAAMVPPNAAQYIYPNSQEATTLWFHDHALGVTRLNVYGGLAAFYLLRDNRDTGLVTNPIALPAGPQEIEIVIQDRMFDTMGQWLFPDLGLNPMVHPFWIPEFFGDTIVVNGKTWPYLNVEQRRYRFRFLDGSNARFYQMALVDQATGLFGPAFWQIGTDGGLLDAPVMMNDPTILNAGLTKPNFIMAPGERADVIIDFTKVPVGTNFVLKNIAKAPFPKGAPADPQTVGQIMQFRVTTPATTTDTSCNPSLAAGTANACALRATPIVRLVNPTTGTAAVPFSVRRQLTLKEVMGMAGPLEVLVNNTKWDGYQAGTMTPIPGSFPSSYSTSMGPNYLTEGPRVGDTEMWEIINLTADAHPIHLHLIQFQLLNRQPFQTSKYVTDWSALFPGGLFIPGYGPPLPYNIANADGALGGNLAVTPYLQGAAVPPNANEAGWKDTIIMHPGEVTRIIARWAPQNVAPTSVTAGLNLFPFDPTLGPGYVWHCHIIDHEDNEMMRPYIPRP
jgi:FtsP/CotA-like multicopper oxidase with cupredoxin domain